MDARVAHALLRSGLFSALSESAFATLVEGVAQVVVAGGEVAVREGDPADAGYVVLSGALEVITAAPDGGEITLGRLGPADHFGEQALLGGAEARRAATVRGSAPRSELIRVDRAAMQAILERDAPLRRKLEALGRRQLEERMSRRTELVRALLGGADTEAHERSFEDGEVLFHEGEAPRAVFVILAGQVELFVDRDGLPLRTALIGAGLCVGERDLGAHAATAVSRGPTRVLEVRRDALARLNSASPEIRSHLATLESVWELPQRGFVTQHLGSVEGRPCVTQLFHLADRRRYVSSHVIGGDALRFEAAQGEPARHVVTPDGAVRVALEADGHIWSIEGSLGVPVLAALFGRAIEGRPLSAAEADHLGTSGALAEAEPDFACACMRVGFAQVRGAIEGGARNLAALQKRTGCGLSCGSCVPRLTELLGETAFVPVEIAAVERLTDTVRRVRLTADRQRAALPGQHLVLRITVDGARVERAYTLSGAAGGDWEITVERTPDGVFSGWLFEHAREGTRLESSQPQGTYFWDGGPAPVVCFCGGIGVTPALAFARTLQREGWPHHLVVDWSTRHEADLAILGELQRPPAVPNLVWSTRITSRAGRLRAADIARWPRRLPSAIYFLCGSPGFMSDVRGALVDAGVPAARIRVEHFEPKRAPG